MATIETPRTGAVTLGDRVAHVFGTIAAWNDARMTRNQLEKLSNRELDDIGLTRGDIHDMFRG